MKIYEKELSIQATENNVGLLSYLSDHIDQEVPSNVCPVRFAITHSDSNRYQCEVSMFESSNKENHIPSIFSFNKRKIENTQNFNVVLLVPTGIGAEIGGHAGDATPVARLLASVCDKLITHPNVVNASDLNEMTDNTLYVEGSVITRLLMGTLGLQETRSNRVVAVIEKHRDSLFTNASINAVNAARASFGLNCPEIIKLESSVKLKANYTSSGSATGEVQNFDELYNILEDRKGSYDAVAITEVVPIFRTVC